MKKNYYELLEISKNASPEVIEKAYKALAKKYHPDLQEEMSKKEAEEKIKEINEAYEIISNPTKREKYDRELEREQQKINTNINTEKQNNTVENVQDPNIKKETVSDEYEERINEAVKQAYRDAYIKDMQNRGYKVKYKRNFKYYLKVIAAVLIIILVVFLLVQIPFVKNYFINLYNNNEIIKSFVDSITTLFKK